MESATNYVKNLLSGYRVPDVSKLWKQSEVDGPEQPQVPILVKLEAYLVRAQELALWIDPKSSIAALAVIQLAYWYLAYTSSTVLNLTAWACILGFVYTTWVNRIWPEIRVEQSLDEASAWTPVRPEVFSAPELVQLTQNARDAVVSAFVYLRELRTTNPGRFCLISCFVFSLIGYLGAYVTALGLFYYTAVGFLTLPGLVRVVCQHHPGLQEQLQAILRRPEQPRVVVTSPEPVSDDLSAPTYSNVYSKVQAQLASMVSNLGSTPSDVEVPQDEVDDLQEYLPEVNDEQTKKILEEGAGVHDHSQEEEMSLDYSSLVTGLGPVMPDVEDDVVDTCRPALTSASSHVASSSVVDDDVEDDEDDEFLPTVDPSHRVRDIHHDDDENRAMSLMQRALHEAAETPAVPTSSRQAMAFPGLDETDDLDREDFEIISEDELAEALKK